jgi:RNA polymerase sigma-70 factor (ECF subfamily)
MNMTAPSRNTFVANANRLEFEKTVLPHFDASYNLARWMTRNAADADDVVQESYMRAFRFFGGFNGGDVRSWMLRIVRNTCYSWLQKNRSADLVYELSEELCDDKSSGPEVEMEENAGREWLRQKINDLPAPFREVIVLRDIQGMSYKEIASVTELPVGTVMSRLARGRERLQKQAGVDEAGGKR